MKLKNVEFNPVLGASGLQNFSGKGYPFHRVLKRIPGFSFDGMTFVAKTTTFSARDGNMPLKSDGETPQERFPKCIWGNPWRGITLNAVGLSGLGLRGVLRKFHWDRRTESFWISFMSVKPTKAERLEEARWFVKIMKEELRNFPFIAQFGIQYNASCPNQKGVSTEEATAESGEVLEILAELSRPMMVKLCVTTAPRQVVELAANPLLDALCVSNAVPFGALPEKIDWHGLFGMPASQAITPELSPLFPRVGMGEDFQARPCFLWLLIGSVKPVRSGLRLISMPAAVFSTDEMCGRSKEWKPIPSLSVQLPCIVLGACKALSKKHINNSPRREYESYSRPD